LKGKAGSRKKGCNRRSSRVSINVWHSCQNSRDSAGQVAASILSASSWQRIARTAAIVPAVRRGIDTIGAFLADPVLSGQFWQGGERYRALLGSNVSKQLR